jgi:DHA1 family bicyclomycin/chloramphenicol resistance-like MFS transporter
LLLFLQKKKTLPSFKPRFSMSALLRRAIVLGLLVAVGAFAIDMYIPGFAAIARELHTDPGHVQLSMTSFFLALSVGQILYGPLSDAIGRRRPVFAGLGVFIAASAVAAFSPTIGALIAARFFQGIGAAATAVVPLAVIRDEYTGPDAARLLSLAMLALSVSPILAPALGGLLVQFGSWRLIFGALIMVAGAGLVLAARLLPETLPPAARVPVRPLRILVTYGRLLRSRRFLLPILCGGCAQVVLFVFISGAPFVFVTLHGLAPSVFGAIFALHAMGLIGISQLNAMLMRRFGVMRLLLGSCACLAAAASVLLVLMLAGDTSPWRLVALTLTMFVALGPIGGPAFLLAMEPFGEIAGSAAALGAALEFGCSTAVTAIMGLTTDGTARPLAIFMFLGAIGALAFCTRIRVAADVAGGGEG